MSEIINGKILNLFYPMQKGGQMISPLKNQWSYCNRVDQMRYMVTWPG